MDNLDFLDAPQGAPEPTPALEAEAPPVEQAEGPARGPDGKFIAREADAPEAVIEPAPEAPAAPIEPQAPQVPPGYVPVSVVQELRAEMRQLRQAPPQAPPDPYEDPAGYAVHQNEVIEQRLLNERLNFSERFARREYGAEVVDKAREWALGQFQNDPHYYNRVMSDADPYEAVVRDWKRDQVLSSMKDGDLDAFLAWKSGAAAGQAQPAPAARVAPFPSPSPPPRSMAADPNAGGAKPGAQPVGPGVAFDNVFKD